MATGTPAPGGERRTGKAWIGVTGAHGVGKTTLVRLFARRNPSFKVIPEAAEELLLGPFAPLREGKFSGEEKRRQLRGLELAILREHLLREKWMLAQRELFLISDRTLVDAWCYCLFHEAFSPLELKALRKIALEEVRRRYDLIAYIPPEEKVVSPPGGAWGETVRHPRELDAVLQKEVLPFLPQDRIVVLRGTPLERAMTLEEKLRKRNGRIGEETR